jgi:general stress protein 26
MLQWRAAPPGENAAMPKPEPEPVDPSQVKQLALEIVEADRFPQLATIDGDQPRLRPISPVRTEEFTVYLANLRFYKKTEQIAANPNVELCYMNDKHDQVRISAVSEIVTDTALLQEIWDANPLMRHYLGSLDNPDLIIYRFTPTQVLYMKEWALDYHTVPL